MTALPMSEMAEKLVVTTHARATVAKSLKNAAVG